MLIGALLALCLGQDTFLGEVRSKLPNPGVPLLEASTQSLTARGDEQLFMATRSGEVLSVKISQPGSTAYSVEIASPPTTEEVKQGDVIFGAIEMRSTEGGRETGEGVFALYMQRASSPWDGIGSLNGSVGREWRRFYFSARSDKDFPAGQMQVTLHVAQQPQTLEVRSFALLNLGKDADFAKLPFTQVDYPGRDLGSPWRLKAAQMIDKNRKAPLAIRVTKNGKPVANALVQIEQTSHEYPFATFLDKDPTLTDADAAQYRRIVPSLFNRVTVPIYWADWGWDKKEERESYFRRIEWAKQLGLRMKAHNVVWPSFKFSPSRLQLIKDKKEEFKSTIITEAKDRVNQLRKFPFENVDVLNELRTERDFANILGESLYKEIFDIAQEGWPKAKLVYNDYDLFEAGGSNATNREENKRIIRRLLADKAPLTMIGWQGHFGESLTAPERVWELLDEYAEFKLPIEITEFDVDTRDEQAQADYTRDLLTAWFAHPATAGFTMWGFHEAYHWRPNGAMFRRDLTPKPNHKVWVELTQNKWRTRETVRTNMRGEAVVRGFRGKYKLAVAAGYDRAEGVAELTGAGSRTEVKVGVPKKP